MTLSYRNFMSFSKSGQMLYTKGQDSTAGTRMMVNLHNGALQTG